MLGCPQSVPGLGAAACSSACIRWAARAAFRRLFARSFSSAPTIFYLCFGLGSVILVRRRLASAYVQTILQATVDMLVLVLLLHACGGVASGLGLLFLLPVGGLAFLLPPRSALFLAAVAAIAMLADTIWQQLGGTYRHQSPMPLPACSAIVLFVIAAAASFAASRMRESEDLVRQKDLDLANLAELSQYIVQHLRESLLVVDAADKIRLINESAAEILGDDHAVPGALGRRGIAALAVFIVHLAAARAKRECTLDLRGGRRRARDSTAFCAARQHRRDPR